MYHDVKPLWLCNYSNTFKDAPITHLIILITIIYTHSTIMFTELVFIIFSRYRLPLVPSYNIYNILNQITSSSPSPAPAWSLPLIYIFKIGNNVFLQHRLPPGLFLQYMYSKQKILSFPIICMKMYTNEYIQKPHTHSHS